MTRGIRGKLLGGLLLVALLGLGIGTVGMIDLKRVSAADTFLYEDVTLPVELAGDIAQTIQRVRANLAMGLVETGKTFIDDHDRAACEAASNLVASDLAPRARSRI